MNWLKAKLALIIIAIVWASLIIACLPLMLVALIYDKKRKNIDWLYSLFLAQDYLTSSILGNHHNTTISSLLGQLKTEQSKTGTIVANIVDWLFKIARNERDHCINAMKPDDVYYFSARRALAGFVLYLTGLTLVYYTFVFFTFINTLWG
jgi:hypothetical protein